jgi:hypothetical protein
LLAIHPASLLFAHSYLQFVFSIEYFLFPGHQEIVTFRFFSFSMQHLIIFLLYRTPSSDSKSELPTRLLWRGLLPLGEEHLLI